MPPPTWTAIKIPAIGRLGSLRSRVCFKPSQDTGASTVFVHKIMLTKIIRHNMMTSSNGNIFRETGPLCGEFTGPGEFSTQRPVTRSFDLYFDLRRNKRLSKQSWGWWFETLSWSFWRHHNDRASNKEIVSMSWRLQDWIALDVSTREEIRCTPGTLFYQRRLSKVKLRIWGMDK